MLNQRSISFDNRTPYNQIQSIFRSLPRQSILAILLVGALLAFEIFNFDTTQFALHDLLGDTAFMNLKWASILAFAFCAIDFAGLIKIFTPEIGGDEPAQVWYLMGAWLLGATLNAIMTWYAVSLVLLQRPLGSEVLSRDQILFIAPIFVAALVWLTRILFIGSIAVAGDQLLNGSRATDGQSNRNRRSSNNSRSGGGRAMPKPKPAVQHARSGGFSETQQPTRSFAPQRERSRSAPQYAAPVRERPSSTHNTQAVRRVNRRPGSAQMVARGRDRR